jgi:uncharacterized membrane protein YkvA (DUF1232 family)
MPFEPPDYAQALRDCVAGYEGSHARSVLRTPEVFELFAALFVHEALPRSARPMIASVLAYFVAPDDVLPEETLGPYGLLDDLYAAAYAFRHLEREVDEALLRGCWRGEHDLYEVMAGVYADSRAAVGKDRKAVLAMAGLSR